MGLGFSNLFTRLSDYYFKRKLNLTMVGLDGAGKTTILHQLKLSEVVMTVPTIGFNVETIQYKNISCTVWDVGGQTVIRPLWQHYFQNTQVRSQPKSVVLKLVINWSKMFLFLWAQRLSSLWLTRVIVSEFRKLVKNSAESWRTITWGMWGYWSLLINRTCLGQWRQLR